MKSKLPFEWSLPVLFLVGRLMVLISLPLDGLRGFGDFVHFYRLAGMGWPFLNYWVEFPPIFPFLSTLLYRLSGGREHIYDYLLVILLSLAQAGCIGIVLRIASKMHPVENVQRRALIYFTLTLALVYGWWYFDPFAVFFTLLGLYWLLEGRAVGTGLALAAGILIKLFPALVLPLVWRSCPPRRAALVTLLALGIPAVLYGSLYLASPSYTLASIRSQASKGSWETIWALADGNFNTGNFGPETERFDPGAALQLRGSPPRLPAWLTLIPFAFLGGWLFFKTRIIKEKSAIAFLGLAWILFLLWSPGWSPQWVLYLLPLILLALPEHEAALFAISLTLINLLEWPVLLSRGYSWGLWLTIPVRTLLFILLAYEFWKEIRRPADFETSLEMI